MLLGESTLFPAVLKKRSPGGYGFFARRGREVRDGLPEVLWDGDILEDTGLVGPGCRVAKE